MLRHHDPCCDIVGEIGEGGIKLVEGLSVERVEDFGAVEGNDGQRGTFFDADVCEFHARKRVAEGAANLEFVEPGRGGCH